MKNNKKVYSTIPIAKSLLKKKYHKIWDLYSHFIFFARNIADNMTIPSFTKVRELSSIEDYFFDTSKCSDKEKYSFIVDMKEEFVKELLAPILVTDIVSTAKKDASNFEYQTWGQLLDYCANSSGSIARFLLGLYDETPSTYIPATSLFTAIQLLDYITHMKYDANYLKRIYIPSEFMEKYNLKPKDLYYAVSSKDLKKLLAETLKRIKKMLKDAEILPSITKDLLLRMQFCMIISASYMLMDKIERSDVLAKEVRLNKFDLFNAYITGIVEGMFTSYKSVATKGMKR